LNGNITKYYAHRAAEYEKIYQRPERQDDLRKLADVLNVVFCGRDVLEIACGTGYWTQFIAKTARRVCAIDCSAEVIEIARQKDYGQCNVSFQESDAYLLANIGGHFTGGFCGFWWSHIPKARIREFMDVFCSKMVDGALVVMMDNKFVEDSSTPISRRDEDGNTYQIRRLEDNTEYEVLKNFPSEVELKRSLESHSKDAEYTDLDYYWLVKYTVCKEL
jgi:demethylmenaquinone methyltransferase/2-methoxy-6-polyprenyl-1,4-benzoquinol methylase